ncbi:recombinase family protein [Akkermansiaceae bacterium]|nr:recombinase family protein [Akkermansiaceae bacterium]
MKIVSYYRVSDKKQEDNFSLAAQKFELNKYAKTVGAEVIGEYQEIESGRRKNRPELNKALNLAKKTKSTLVVVRLDRLARSVSFISTLIESKVDFKALDLPMADKFTLHIFSALAEKTSEDISIRTKMGMAEAKRQGKVFGENAKVLAKAYKRAADDYAYALNATVERIISSSRRLTYQKLANKLNAVGVQGRNGGKFYASSARLLVKRLGLSI